MAGITLESRLPEICDDAEARAEKAVEKTVADIEASAKAHLAANGSVDTGDLFNDVVGESDGLEGEVSTSLYYSIFVEMGTGRLGAESEFPGKPGDLHYSVAGRDETRTYSIDSVEAGATTTETRFNPDWAGMTARPYMTPAAEESRGPFEQAMGQIFQ